MWIALKDQTVRRAGSYVDIKAGEAIPEAENWPNRSAWERRKFIKRISSDVLPVPKAAITGISPVVVPEQPAQIEVEKPKRGRPPKTQTKPVFVDLDELA
jgi:hypothetical protein